MELREKVVVVTGAASGIGRGLATGLAERGARLAISDVDEAGLDETATAVRSMGATVTSQNVDVSQLDQIRDHRDRVVEDHGHVDVVINNAGVAINATLADTAYEEMQWLLDINLWGVIYGSMEFLPLLEERPEAHLCNISSVSGLFTNPMMGAYCTSKFAVRGFTQTLTQELKGSNVVVSCVHPGGVRSQIVANALHVSDPEKAQSQFNRYLGHTSPETAANQILRGIERERKRMLVGWLARTTDLTSRIFPSGWQRLMAMEPRELPGDEALDRNTDRVAP